MDKLKYNPDYSMIRADKVEPGSLVKVFPRSGRKFDARVIGFTRREGYLLAFPVSSDGRGRRVSISSSTAVRVIG